MRVPRAFTIIELLTALVLMAVGLAAFTRAAGAVARLERDARIRRLIAATLQARLDSLALSTCGQAYAGEASLDGLHEHWRADPARQHLALDVAIESASRPGLSRRLTVSVPCHP